MTAKGVRTQRTVANELAVEVRDACLGKRVSRLHRIVARVYEQALQTVGISLPQMEILTELVGAPGPVRPGALASRMMLERSTVSRNLAIMQKRGWITVVESSPTGRAMSVTIADAGLAAYTERERGLARRPMRYSKHARAGRGFATRPVDRSRSGMANYNLNLACEAADGPARHATTTAPMRRRSCAGWRSSRTAW